MPRAFGPRLRHPLIPVLALALATIGVNLLTDAFGRAAGVDLAKEGQA